MLRSQGSSTSFMSNDDELTLSYPEKFRESLLLSKKVVFVDGKVSVILLTSLCELVECRGREVINSINLTGHVIIDEGTRPDEIEFDVIFLDSQKVQFVLRIQSVLLGIERKPSELKLLKVHAKVRGFKVVLDPTTHDVAVRVTSFNNTKWLTRFKDDEVESFLDNVSSFTSVFRGASKKKAAVQCHLNKVTEDIVNLSSTLFGDRKMLPKAMLEDDPHEKSPLMRYGSIWSRVVNEKVVIGIPVICLSKR